MFVLLLGTIADDALAASQCGKAAWYDRRGRAASGEWASATAMTAAHRSLPFGTRVRVENLDNGRSVVVRINDRGPAERDRVIDVSRSAARQLGFIESGITSVRLTTLADVGPLAEAPCADRGADVALQRAPPLTLPRERPAAAPAEVMAARFGLAFQDDEAVAGEMAKAMEALFGDRGRR
jgi:rare lipoprotein A